MKDCICKGTGFVYDMNTMRDVACPMCYTSKYHNSRPTVSEIVFDSAAEAERYLALKDMAKCGEITDLVLQPAYEVLPSFSCQGKHHHSITYRPDFGYTESSTGKRVVEDVKGFATDVFKIKAKMFRYRYPDIELRVIEA